MSLCQCFNPRPCARGDRLGGNILGASLEVSIHAPARGATACHRDARRGRAGFNPRPCARGDNPSPLISTRLHLFQSTPLREGRRKPNRIAAMPVRVSIHAPARGATIFSLRKFQHLTCFNPRPCARGDSSPYMARPAPCGSFNPRPCARGDSPTAPSPKARPSFQSTPLREGRQHFLAIPVLAELVSIHAPARGATSSSQSMSPHHCQFQSTPLREGRRDVMVLPQTDVNGFQSTPLREGRQCHRVHHRRRARVSIHAPARGATASHVQLAPAAERFQSTPLREGRRARGPSATRFTGFNPRPCARGDPRCRSACFDTRRSFNPRPCARGDACARRRPRHAFRVSIHAPARGATRPQPEPLLGLLEFQSTPLREGRRASSAR